MSQAPSKAGDGKAEDDEAVEGAAEATKSLEVPEVADDCFKAATPCASEKATEKRDADVGRERTSSTASRTSLDMLGQNARESGNRSLE